MLGNSAIAQSAIAQFPLSSVAKWFFFNGSIDDVQVYGRALSPSEVSQIYNAGKFGISAIRFATGIASPIQAGFGVAAGVTATAQVASLIVNVGQLFSIFATAGISNFRVVGDLIGANGLGFSAPFIPTIGATTTGANATGNAGILLEIIGPSPVGIDGIGAANPFSGEVDGPIDGLVGGSTSTAEANQLPSGPQQQIQSAFGSANATPFTAEPEFELFGGVTGDTAAQAIISEVIASGGAIAFGTPSSLIPTSGVSVISQFTGTSATALANTSFEIDIASVSAIGFASSGPMTNIIIDLIQSATGTAFATVLPNPSPTPEGVAGIAEGAATGIVIDYELNALPATFGEATPGVFTRAQNLTDVFGIGSVGAIQVIGALIGAIASSNPGIISPQIIIPNIFQASGNATPGTITGEPEPILAGATANSSAASLSWLFGELLSAVATGQVQPVAIDFSANSALAGIFATATANAAQAALPIPSANAIANAASVVASRVLQSAIASGISGPFEYVYQFVIGATATGEAAVVGILKISLNADNAVHVHGAASVTITGIELTTNIIGSASKNLPVS